MKFLLDHNLPPRLARALNELSTELAPDIEVHALRERFPVETPDHVWIEALSREGGWAVITRDTIYKTPLNKEALRRNGLVVFCLERAWSKQKFWPIAAKLVDWWPEIVDQAQRIEGGAAFYVPWHRGSKGKFKQVRV